MARETVLGNPDLVDLIVPFVSLHAEHLNKLKCVNKVRSISSSIVEDTMTPYSPQTYIPFE